MAEFFEIPVPQSVVPFNQEVTLDDEVYRMEFRYNLRDEAWRMTLSRSGTVLLRNLKVVNSEDLLAQFRHDENVPQNALRVIDLDGRFKDPGATDFGDRVLMVYEEEE